MDVSNEFKLVDCAMDENGASVELYYNSVCIAIEVDLDTDSNLCTVTVMNLDRSINMMDRNIQVADLEKTLLNLVIAISS